MRFYHSNNHPTEYAFHLYDNFVVTLCVIVRSRRYLSYSHLSIETFINIYLKPTILKHCDVIKLFYSVMYYMFSYINIKYSFNTQYIIHMLITNKSNVMFNLT